MIISTLFMLFFFSALLAFISLVMWGESKIFYTTIMPDALMRWDMIILT